MAPFMKGGQREVSDLPSFHDFGKAFNMRTVIQQLAQSDRACWVSYPRDMRIRQWIHRSGRVALLGSGAYSLAPLPLYETALSIEDAAVLAHALAAKKHKPDALAHYADRRISRVQTVQDLAWRIHAQTATTSSWQQTWRNFWMAGPGRFTFSRRHQTLSSSTL